MCYGLACIHCYLPPYTPCRCPTPCLPIANIVTNLKYPWKPRNRAGDYLVTQPPGPEFYNRHPPLHAFLSKLSDCCAFHYSVEIYRRALNRFYENRPLCQTTRSEPWKASPRPRSNQGPSLCLEGEPEATHQPRHNMTNNKI